MKLKIARHHYDQRQDHGNRFKLLKPIQSFPGIRYNDLIRLTGLNKGTLSHHLTILEKDSIIRILRPKNSNMTRYFTASISNEEAIIIGFLKIKTTSHIICLLKDNKQLTFLEIVRYTRKSLSTTSWNLKRLLEAGIVIRYKSSNASNYCLKHPEMIIKLKNKSNKMYLTDLLTTILI